MKGLFLIISVFCSIFPAESALALQLTTTAQGISDFGPCVYDADTATSGSIASISTCMGGAYVAAQASADSSGALQAETFGIPLNFSTSRASASFAETLQNYDVVERDYFFDFHLTGLLWISEPGDFLMESTRSFTADLLVDGITLWTSGAVLVGDSWMDPVLYKVFNLSHLESTGEDLGGTFTLTEPINGNYSAAYQFDYYSGLVSLGSLLPGGAADFEFMITTSYKQGDHGAGYAFLFADLGRINSQYSEVPEPATLFLFGTGVIGLVSSRGKRQKKYLTG